MYIYIYTVWPHIHIEQFKMCICVAKESDASFLKTYIHVESPAFFLRRWDYNSLSITVYWIFFKATNYKYTDKLHNWHQYENLYSWKGTTRDRTYPRPHHYLCNRCQLQNKVMRQRAMVAGNECTWYPEAETGRTVLERRTLAVMIEETWR